MHMPHMGETVLVFHKDTHGAFPRAVPAIVQQVFYHDQGPTQLSVVAFPPGGCAKNLTNVPWYPSAPRLDDDFEGAWPRNTHHAHVGEADVSGDAA